jgi:large subunit ribosomal protein L29
MSAADLRQLDAEDLETRLGEAKEELFNLRFQLATNQLDNTSRIREVKKEIARILGVMREQEIAAWRTTTAGKDS